uniref:DUF6356 family protein n=1 Tax=Pararhizobium sp. IMCC3301 TaxID=3067904 RepID=UPI00274158FF|nr:DUF6356 family protein [Pararhizobium sp. IMCC3301]
MQIVRRLFVDHPASVDESYFEHMRFAGGFSAQLCLAGCAALIHALIPGLFEKTAGNIICKLHYRIHNRR